MSWKDDFLNVEAEKTPKLSKWLEWFIIKGITKENIVPLSAPDSKNAEAKPMKTLYRMFPQILFWHISTLQLVFNEVTLSKTFHNWQLASCLNI